MAIQKIKADGLGRESYDFPNGGTINWREVKPDPSVKPGEPGWWPGIYNTGETQQMVNKDTCNSKQTIVGRSVYMPGDTHEPHLHHHAEEVMYCLSGKCVVGSVDKEYIMVPGDVQYSPIGEIHWLRNPFNEPVEFIWIYSGASVALESGYATPDTFDTAMDVFSAGKTPK